ncbi:unnamed protein product [Fraxinus pennsylvanica]|uniref:Ankyrin repeat protein n=1 Tax=Fraxinus pennsylvanica TaxID=56036 RepID=A0AAD1ZU08_9LAMI|nr:unnamed protein product [Fraxinus pennsylvanica]
MSLKPSFIEKLNPDGFTPLHLALHINVVETVKRLVKCDPTPIHVPGRERITPSHYAAEINSVELLAEFLVSCPESIKDLTACGDTAVHVVVRTRGSEVLKNMNNVNDKNSQDMTALDIAMSLPAEMNTKIKIYLCRAGASRASLRHKNVSLADFMGSQE